ncbi:uncharacterized protein A4U43_C02F4440 [Asparagus officinalis]|uniref:Uncharacterized protein n=1 Tax=Asparagus officinalis TaxID=4686 RepID=A0A5P1FGK0_ASPOF|nr:uncharacterized protein At3g27210-like [Asparagus officinalis]ONK77232.1 uncharacterized protein A4U43_C02F4440 [Asparagus officinalis]
MRFHLGLGSKAKRFLLSSRAKKKKLNGENPIGEFGFNSKSVVDSGFEHSGFGGKEESFFDSEAWFDSDCEDDFFSVNGDFTPSCGNTPNHQLSIPTSPQVNKSLNPPTHPDSKSELSPHDGKKKLFDLLQESVRHADTNKNTDDRKLDNGQPLKSFQESPYLSGTNSVWSSELTPSGDSNYKKERAGRHKHCCFPGLTPSRSFSERRKQKMSPARVNESR